MRVHSPAATITASANLAAGIRREPWRRRYQPRVPGAGGHHGSREWDSQTILSGLSDRTMRWPSVRGPSRSLAIDRRVARDTTGPRDACRRRPPANRTCDPAPGAVALRAQLEFAVHRLVVHTGWVDPLGDGVVGQGARVVKLTALDVDRLAREPVVAATVVIVQVRVHHHVDRADSRSLACRAGRSCGSMSATAGCDSVSPVSTRIRASGCSMTWTYTGIHWSSPTIKSATWTGRTVCAARLGQRAGLGEDHPPGDRLEDARDADVDLLVDQIGRRPRPR